jgi:hypothetical protein
MRLSYNFRKISVTGLFGKEERRMGKFEEVKWPNRLGLVGPD